MSVQGRLLDDVQLPEGFEARWKELERAHRTTAVLVAVAFTRLHVVVEVAGRERAVRWRGDGRRAAEEMWLEYFGRPA